MSNYCTFLCHLKLSLGCEIGVISYQPHVNNWCKWVKLVKEGSALSGARRREKERELRQQYQFYYHIKRGLEWDTLPALCPQDCTCSAGSLLGAPSVPPPPLSGGLLLFSLSPFLWSSFSLWSFLPVRKHSWERGAHVPSRGAFCHRPAPALHTRAAGRLCLHFWEFVWAHTSESGCVCVFTSECASKC